MTAADADELATEVAAAHGAPILATVNDVAVSFSSGGLAFAAKRQPFALSHAKARLSSSRQEASLTGSRPRPWTLEVSDSDDLRARLARLRQGRQRRRWEPEDLAAFAAAALWTYVTMPLLLADAERIERLPDAAARRRLRVTLPDTIAGHGSVHTLHIGSTGLIERHDYTAMAFGTWARAAQNVEAYETFDGVPIGTRRRVAPRLLGRRAPGPTLVWIDIHDVCIS